MDQLTMIINFNILLPKKEDHFLLNLIILGLTSIHYKFSPYTINMVIKSRFINLYSNFFSL